MRWPRPRLGVVVLDGEVDLASARALDEAIESVLEESTRLVLDLSSASFIDSYVIGTILKARRDADVRGVEFNVVVGDHSIVAKALEIAEVLPRLNRVSRLDDALDDRK